MQVVFFTCGAVITSGLGLMVLFLIPKSIAALETMERYQRLAHLAGVETSTLVGYFCDDAEMSAGLRTDLASSMRETHGAICVP